MKPHPFIEKEYKYRRKASLAYCYKHKIRGWFYTLIADYYEQKFYKKFMSS